MSKMYQHCSCCGSLKSSYFIAFVLNEQWHRFLFFSISEFSIAFSQIHKRFSFLISGFFKVLTYEFWIWENYIILFVVCKTQTEINNKRHIMESVWAGKLKSCDECKEIFMEYDQWNTAKYATAFWLLYGWILQGMG